MRRLLMLPLLFAVTTGGVLNALAEENQSNESAEIRITECWFAGQTNNNVTFTCVLTNITEHPVEIVLSTSEYTFSLSTLTGEGLGYLGIFQGLYGRARRQPSLLIPAYESRIYEKAIGAFGFDKPHQGDVRVRVSITPCPYSFPTNSLPGVMLFDKDLKFDGIMKARQVGDFLSIKPK